MKHFLAAFFSLLFSTCMAQSFPRQYVDSLTAIALSRTSNHPLVLNRDSVLQLLWKNPDPAAKIAMFYDIVAFSDELTPAQSLYYHQLILEGAQKQGDKVLEASVMAELGFITSMNGNTTGGLKMLYESLEKAESTSNAQAIGIVYNNLGNCYPNNKKLSVEYWTKALEYSRKGNDHLFVCFDLGNLANTFMQDQKKDSALAYYLEAYRLGVEKNLEASIPGTLLSLSRLDDKAYVLHYLWQAEKMPFSKRSAEMKNGIIGRRANYYIDINRMDSAFHFVSQFYNNARNANLNVQLTALNLMVRYYRAVPNTDSTLSYLERFHKLKDSIYGDRVIGQAQEMAYKDMQRQKELTAQKISFQNRLILYLVSAVAIFLMALTFIFWRSKRKEQLAKKMVEQQKGELEQTINKLKATQSQLIQSEKMASLGELTAGIAHEIQNPLNFVNNFSEVNAELVDEMKEELIAGKIEDAISLADDIKANNEKISFHGKRADSIVKGMLQHSRSSSAVKEPTNINKLADEYLRLAYHGLRAKDKNFNANYTTQLDTGIATINIIPQDIGRVLLNLFTNSFYSVMQKKKIADNNYQPLVTVQTKKENKNLYIIVEDNGVGIPQKVIDKVFQPFFTTKPSGEGTGLGLSLSYDIITKGHGGELKVETREGEFARFIIVLPL